MHLHTECLIQGLMESLGHGLSFIKIIMKFEFRETVTLMKLSLLTQVVTASKHREDGQWILHCGFWSLIIESGFKTYGIFSRARSSHQFLELYFDSSSYWFSIRSVLQILRNRRDILKKFNEFVYRGVEVLLYLGSLIMFRYSLREAGKFLYISLKWV